MTAALRCNTVCGVDYDDDDNGEREAGYIRNREALPGLLQLGKTREYIAYVAAAVAIVYAGASRWQTSSQLSECKQEKQDGWVVVLDADGERLNVTPVAASKWHLTDGMVKHRLGEVVECVRGLDPIADVTLKCWDESTLLFFSDAKREIEAYGKELYPNAGSVETRLRTESIAVHLESWRKPDSHAPNRYLLTWNEVHKPKNGRSITEAWSGMFDVDLVPIDPKLNNSPMRIVRYEWHCDAGCGGKGGA